MKRMHVNMKVSDLAASVRFYEGLFGEKPSVLKPDYAKWMLEDPRVNFAISTHGGGVGLDHLGIQAEDSSELAETYARLKAVDGPMLEQGNTVCCYAASEKSWVTDPDGTAWEAFLTHGESTIYGDGSGQAPAKAESACCAPAPSACCAP
jgi:catechol 2,3-dioxygenase-like lactoylglutathione lyase family enzyme